MSADRADVLDGPEMTELRELRAEVDGPSDAQRAAAWERVQGARSQVPERSGGNRRWMLAAVAAASAGVLGLGVAVAALGGDDPVAPASSATPTAAPTNPNPTPFATGSVWEPQGKEEATVVETYREDNIHLLPDGGLRIDIPEEMSWEAMTKATNAEGIPVRFWAVDGTKGEWESGPVMRIDGEDGVDTSAEGGPAYPQDKITEERAGGPGSRLTALVFEEIPTTPVDITFTQ